MSSDVNEPLSEQCNDETPHSHWTVDRSSAGSNMQCSPTQTKTHTTGSREKRTESFDKRQLQAVTFTKATFFRSELEQSP